MVKKFLKQENTQTTTRRYRFSYVSRRRMITTSTATDEEEVGGVSLDLRDNEESELSSTRESTVTVILSLTGEGHALKRSHSQTPWLEEMLALKRPTSLSGIPGKFLTGARGDFLLSRAYLDVHHPDVPTRKTRPRRTYRTDSATSCDIPLYTFELIISTSSVKWILAEGDREIPVKKNLVLILKRDARS